jgi:hypothetical protein
MVCVTLPDRGSLKSGMGFSRNLAPALGSNQRSYYIRTFLRYDSFPSATLNFLACARGISH